MTDYLCTIKNDIVARYSESDLLWLMRIRDK